MMQPEKVCPEASQMVRDVLRSIRMKQVTNYLERTGWTLWANTFSWKDGWALCPDVANPPLLLYIKPDPEAKDRTRPFVVEVPGREESWEYLSTLQSALERIATIEQTTFVTVVCHILDVQQVVLYPLEDQQE